MKIHIKSPYAGSESRPMDKILPILQKYGADNIDMGDEDRPFSCIIYLTYMRDLFRLCRDIKLSVKEYYHKTTDPVMIRLDEKDLEYETLTLVIYDTKISR